jgi:hypothetical protein
MAAPPSAIFSFSLFGGRAVVVAEAEVGAADAALDPQLRRDPVLRGDHGAGLDQAGGAELVLGDGLRVALDLEQDRQALVDHAADVEVELAGDRIVVAARALHRLVADLQAAEAEREAERQPATAVMEAAGRGRLRIGGGVADGARLRGHGLGQRGGGGKDSGGGEDERRSLHRNPFQGDRKVVPPDCASLGPAA